MKTGEKGCGCAVLAVVGLVAVVIAAPRHEPSAAETQSGIHCLGGFSGEFRPLREAVRGTLRDPASFEVADTAISPLNADGVHVVSMTYRARNGFGGMNVETARATVDTNCRLIEVLGD